MIKPGPFGLAGNRYSLPRQWELIRKSNLNLSVPSYYLGRLIDIPKDKVFVYSNPHHYYYWKANQNDSLNSSFAFEKPQGSPFICLVFGSKCKVFPYNQETKFTQDDLYAMENMARKVSHFFKDNTVEILFFLNEHELTFGMISNIPYASQRKEWFTTTVDEFVDEILMNNALSIV